MNKHRTRNLICALLAAMAMLGCAVFGQDVLPTSVDQPAAGTDRPTVVSGQPGGQEQPGQPTPAATPTEQPPARTRGTGDFNLLNAAVGLDGLNRYRATLEMTFDGTRDGAPYQMKKAYDVIVIDEIDARSQVQTSTAADGTLKQVFSAAFGNVRYLQGAPDQPCQASILEKAGPPPFDPAAMLPLLEGASAAGGETVNGVEADVYTFDALALNAGPGAEAAGKLWVAKNGGWLAKYELSLRSSSLFGAGISGEQRWLYTVSEVGTVGLNLPETCPQGEVDLPLPEGAQVSASLPGYQELDTALAPENLVAFYTDALLANYWTQQGGPVVNGAVTHLVFSRPVQDKEQMAVITIRAGEGGSAVTIFEILTDPVAVE